ncbi:MAG: BTAD domain-containing putative transcriptional regulator [Ardenticatenaceae bacterium]|nr:BTAD domain-containing putative transcriptional regulator [Ardenticatenaceae bacterium]
MRSIELKLFGYPTVWRDGEQITGFISEKALALLIYVAETGETHARDYLTGLLWGDTPEKKARASLRSALYNIGQLLPEALEVTRKTVALAADLHSQSAQMRRHNDPTVHTADFLAGFFISNAPEFEEWQLRQREQLRVLAVSLWEKQAVELTDTGRLAEAIKAWEALINLEPWREEPHRRIMRLYTRLGDFEGALRQFESCKAMLQTELGVEPTVAVLELAKRVKLARTQPRDNLPTDVGPFFGRETLLAQIDTYLRDRPLITLAGLGGIGKTRLALALGYRHRYRFLNGVAFINLEGIIPEDDARTAAATAIVRTLTAAGLFPNSRDPAEKQLLSLLPQREMLLILDNFEHLRDGVLLLDALLKAAPGLRLLVTSRERLRLTQEQLIRLDGLSETAAEALFVSAARRLQPDFQTDPAVIQICRQVGGMPLAVELAAGSTDVKSPSEIAAELETTLAPLTRGAVNRAPRHQSIPYLFDLAWRRLAESQQHILARLTVFQSGFTAKAAREVAGASRSDLQLFVGRSLLQREGGWYRMHPLLRQFGQARITAEAMLRQAHAEFLVGTLTTHQPHLEGGDQLVALDALSPWEDDALAAWKWVVEAQAWSFVGRMLLPFVLYFEMRSRYKEVLNRLAALTVRLEKFDSELHGRAVAFRAWIEMGMEHENRSGERAVALTQNADPQTRALALLSFAGDLNDQFDFAQTYDLAQQALTLSRQVGDHRLINRALLLMANCTIPDRLNRPDEGEHLYREAAAVAREAGDKRSLSITLHNHGWAHFYQGQYQTAEQILRETTALHEEMRQPQLQIMSQMMVARAIAYQNRHNEAEKMVIDALDRGQSLHAVVPMLQLLTVLATEIYIPTGRQDAAATLVQFIQHHSATTTHLHAHLAQFEIENISEESAGWTLNEVLSFIDKA